MTTHRGVHLFLSRFAEGEWQGIVRPWLEEGRGRLERSLVVAPTRGHTHALKRRCLSEGVPLLGVEFLTPGRSRGKRGAQPGPGRSLQLLILRAQIAARMESVAPDDPERLLWRSLGSDLETALRDFEEMIRAGYRAEDFSRPELREVFGGMVAWMGRHGYVLGPMADEAAGLAPPDPGAAPVAERLLILAGGPEGWREFFGLAALARRSPSVTVAVAEPEFGGRGPSGEAWVKVWEALLGAEAQAVDTPDPAESCADIALLMDGEAKRAERVGVIVERSMHGEMDRVGGEIGRLLQAGADNVAVVFPRADSAHALLARILGERGIPFADLIGSSGTPPLDTQVQRALADFYEGGCRLEELLALWPLLSTQNLARITVERARAVCQKFFDEVQSHGIEARIALLEESPDADRREVARVARLLLPGWPEMLTLSDALSRFEGARDRLAATAPSGWGALREFAGRAADPMPAAAILEAIRAFLPEKGPPSKPPPSGGFAHVTLTLARWAAGVAWSEVIFVESNKGIWPERREPSCWLDDEERRRLTASGRFSLGLPTSDERAAIDRGTYTAIVRDTRRGVIFSASRNDAKDSEAELEPNAWLERVLWSRSLFSQDGGRSGAFGLLGEPAPRPTVPLPGAPAAWFGIWSRRRDPNAPFDEFFFADPQGERPGSLGAGLIERGIEDPVRLWFDAVLRIRRVDWRPFGRAKPKLVGTAVHRVLSRALRGAPVEGVFFQMAPRAQSEARLEAELATLRALWPSNRYWESILLDVGGAARDLLGLVYGLPAARFGAAEVRIPENATIPAGSAGRIGVRGQMDLVLSDRPGWEGASVEIADFKTGGDAGLSKRRMASSGASLQLGVYLEAARSVGAAGSVWMLKPGEKPTSIALEELPGAVSKLGVLGLHLSTGIYGALTPDRDDYTHGFEWPLACAPIASAVLRQKFERTFGAGAAAEPEEAADE